MLSVFLVLANDFNRGKIARLAPLPFGQGPGDGSRASHSTPAWAQLRLRKKGEVIQL